MEYLVQPVQRQSVLIVKSLSLRKKALQNSLVDIVVHRDYGNIVPRLVQGVCFFEYAWIVADMPCRDYTNLHKL